MKSTIIAPLSAPLGGFSGPLSRWTPYEANRWYQDQKWLVGAGYLTSNAINQLEMWQAETFDLPRIERELGWAEQVGLNTMRVFLHDALWRQDTGGITRRVEQFLACADRRGIKPMLVLFDSCGDADPKLGPQRPPIPGVENSGWVQGPGRAILGDQSRHKRMRTYVETVVGAFADDPRILCWDVWNEPDNASGCAADSEADPVSLLLPQVFAWARSRHPIQPLSSGLWRGDGWADLSNLSRIQKIQIEQSDIITFHDYAWPESFERRILELKTYGRPLICTEYLARSAGSMIDTILPLAKSLDVGMISRGFVNGRSQTDLPRDSWQRPYVERKPDVWFHDLLHQDGTPYRQREIEIIRALASAPRIASPANAG